MADAAYGSASNLGWLVEGKGIGSHIPAFDKSARRDDTFARSVFAFDHDDNSYNCPGGKRLRPSNRNFKSPRPLANADGFIRYRASQKDCPACDFKQCCTPNMMARKIMRSVHEGARDTARDITTTDAYLVSRRQRKKAEMLFAHQQRILKLDRLRLRGRNGAKDEFHLAATAQNLSEMAKVIPMPSPAPPRSGTGSCSLSIQSATRVIPHPTSSADYADCDRIDVTIQMTLIINIQKDSPLGSELSFFL